MKCVRWSALGFLLLACAARAEVPIDGQLDDRFSSATPVAGQVLAGLWAGEPLPTISLDPTRLALPLREAGQKLCMTASTRDGQYSGYGEFKVPPGPRDEARIATHPKHAGDLAAYQAIDLGIRAELKPDCAGATPGAFLPIMSGAPPGALVVLINSQRAIRVAAVLQTKAGADLETGACTKFTAGRSTAFDWACRFKESVASIDGEYVLAVDRLTRSGDNENDSFVVVLGATRR